MGALHLANMFNNKDLHHSSPGCGERRSHARCRNRIYKKMSYKVDDMEERIIQKADLHQRSTSKSREAKRKSEESAMVVDNKLNRLLRTFDGDDASFVASDARRHF
jgi:hypothetical protein